MIEKLEKWLKNKLAAQNSRKFLKADFGHLRLNFWAQVVVGNCKWSKREDPMSSFKEMISIYQNCKIYQFSKEAKTKPFQF